MSVRFHAESISSALRVSWPFRTLASLYLFIIIIIFFLLSSNIDLYILSLQPSLGRGTKKSDVFRPYSSGRVSILLPPS